MEKEKLLGWAVLAKMSENETFASASLRVNRHIVIDSFQEIQKLLFDFSKLVRKTRGSPGEPGTPLRHEYLQLQKKALNLMEKTRKYPKRLRWATFDKAQFEKLLSNLMALNDSMMSFLEAYERGRHFQMQEATFMQILLVNNRIDDLFDILHSLKSSKIGNAAVHDISGNIDQHGYKERLIRLTRFKAINITIGSQDRAKGKASVNNLPTDSSDDTVLEIDGLKELASHNVNRPTRSSGLLKRSKIWVEWRYYEEVGDSEGPPPFVAQRIYRLVKLLGEQEKPVEFHVPSCLGYVHDKYESRFGLVFQSLGSDNLPIGLLEMLTTTKKPSLTTRVRIACTIATSIWYLHATNWLHKGLRSENVVLQSCDRLRTASPFLCGFDYSRPSHLGEETERPVENPMHDIYRHPNVQFDVPRDGRSGFNKLYDAYSLGVVLYEVGVWMSIDKFLDFTTLKPSVVKSVKSRLLDQDSIDALESETGETFVMAVKACLDGELVPDSDMSRVDSDARLQLNFGDQVVKRLEAIQV
ncbi:protein kinase, catalytic domain-containingprotein [Fusarium austroafricanum]|uniref:Protein kinase, catalytic domain-containingprotein n=1 Tax=Fusarium austroafricanum TaxID=2364996 RepID=A0A8H4KEI6_9HYPO|nr:protein kinase, catalytic domain-containingprotein [Fusarium austroafricanum]